MSIHIVILQILVNHPLGEVVGVEIRGLFGSDELFHDLWGGHNPAHPHPRGDDLGESPEKN